MTPSPTLFSMYHYLRTVYLFILFPPESKSKLSMLYPGPSFVRGRRCRIFFFDSRLAVFIENLIYRYRIC